MQNLDPAIRFGVIYPPMQHHQDSQLQHLAKKKKKENKNHPIATTSLGHVNINDAAPANNDCTWEVSINVICS